MSSLVLEKLKRSLEAAEGRYYRLVLLVGESGSGKTAVLRDLAEALQLSVVNINLELSAALLELTPKKRSLDLPLILGKIGEQRQGLLIWDNLEILFGNDFKQDPLRLLLGISRNRTVVASWNGSIISKSLIYAELGHPEYRSYDLGDALVVEMDGKSTID